MVFFSKKNILILVEGKKNNLIQSFLSYSLMLYSGKKNSRFARQKKKYFNSRVVRKKILNETIKP